MNRLSGHGASRRFHYRLPGPERLEQRALLTTFNWTGPVPDDLWGREGNLEQAETLPGAGDDLFTAENAGASLTGESVFQLRGLHGAVQREVWHSSTGQRRLELSPTIDKSPACLVPAGRLIGSQQ